MVGGSTTIERLEQEIESEFQDETRDVLDNLEVMLGNVESGLVDAQQALARLQKTFLSLDVRSQSVDNAAMSIVAHRAGEYLSDLSGLARTDIADLQVFIDTFRKLLARGPAAAGESPGDLVRQLPSRRIVDFDVVEAARKINVEVLLVIPDRATSHYVERELAACGYRVSNARTFFKGLELAVRTQPDYVIAAAVLDDASGIDLARALAAISATQHIPFSLLTSYAPGHPSLTGLPSGAAVIRKGAPFAEDVAGVLAKPRRPVKGA